jgi:hydroxyacylglutathione hydrolase
VLYQEVVLNKTLRFVISYTVLLVLAIAFPAFAFENITPLEVKQKLDAKEDVFILDVRQPEEYAQGYIPKAYLIPLGELAQRLNEVTKDKYLIVVCQSGGRSAKASQLLDDNGYNNVHNMLNGTPAYKNLPEYLCIKADDLKDQLAGLNALILDVRTTEEFDKRHIEGAVSIPIDQLSDRKKEIPQDKGIVIIGADNDQGTQASKKLIELGYKDVKNLEDGMLSWDDATGVSSKGKLITTFAAIKTRE